MMGAWNLEKICNQIYIAFYTSISGGKVKNKGKKQINKKKKKRKKKKERNKNAVIRTIRIEQGRLALHA